MLGAELPMSSSLVFFGQIGGPIGRYRQYRGEESRQRSSKHVH